MSGPWWELNEECVRMFAEETKQRARTNEEAAVWAWQVGLISLDEFASMDFPEGWGNLTYV